MEAEFPMGRGAAPAVLARMLVLRFCQACEAVGAFAADSREPAGLVALGASGLIIVGSFYVILTADPNRIHAHPPPPPSRIEIRQAVATSSLFSTAPPASRSASGPKGETQ